MSCGSKKSLVVLIFFFGAASRVSSSGSHQRFLDYPGLVSPEYDTLCGVLYPTSLGGALTVRAQISRNVFTAAPSSMLFAVPWPLDSRGGVDGACREDDVEQIGVDRIRLTSELRTV